jgi:hypothetical protein
VASRGKAHRRGRSRKRRPVTANAPQAGAGQGSAGAGSAGAGQAPVRAPERSSTPPGGRRARPRGAAERGGERFKDPLSVGERPQAPWHPLPLSELLILIGAIGTVVGLLRGPSSDAPLVFAGLAAVMIGTVEVTLREHLSGYRSHTVILALLPTIVFHSAVILIAAAFIRPPRALNVGLLVVDIALFAVLFKLLRARFTDARRERAFAARR